MRQNSLGALARFRDKAPGLFCLVLALGGQGCFLPSEGGAHREDERMAVARVFHGKPIVGHALAWVGEGDVPNNGAGVQNYWFLRDRWAFGGGANVTRFRLEPEKVNSWDVEARVRYYAFEAGPAAFFGDVAGGLMVAEHGVPEAGTRKNYTFSFGPGVEIPTGLGPSLLLGCEFHHFSNARGRNASDNPSQNEYLPWAGVGFRW
jgi:hypothetical protein